MESLSNWLIQSDWLSILKDIEGVLVTLEEYYLLMSIERGPYQDTPFFYTPYHFSELKSFKSLISTHFLFIFIFKYCMTQFSHWIVSWAILNCFYSSRENQLQVFCYGFFWFFNNAHFHIYFSWELIILWLTKIISLVK